VIAIHRLVLPGADVRPGGGLRWPQTLDDIRAQFGEVADIVEACTMLTVFETLGLKPRRMPSLDTVVPGVPDRVDA
jgi:hypothetical protein